jgi:solute carrier family 25 uncoupling protein 8/9
VVRSRCVCSKEGRCVFAAVWSPRIMSQNPPGRFKVGREIACGSLGASFTACLFNPLELVKTRLQVQSHYACPATGALPYRGATHAMRTIAAEEGLGALWRHGFAGFVGRDFTYSGLRIGLYPTVREMLSPESSGEAASLPSKIVSGCTTGVVGSVLATPIDVMRVRTSVESGRISRGVFQTGLCKGHGVRFCGAIDCIGLLVREGGVVGLWRGWGPTCARAAMLSGAQLASYDHSKVWMLRWGVFDHEGKELQFVCAMFSGVVAATACNPADVLKSYMMLADTNAPGSKPAGAQQRLSMLATTLSILRHHGVLGLYKGWVPAVSRAIVSQSVQMPLVEWLRSCAGLGSI